MSLSSPADSSSTDPRPRIAVDVSNEALYGGATLAEVWERGSIGANADPKYSPALHLPCSHVLALDGRFHRAVIPTALLTRVLGTARRQSVAESLWQRARSQGAWSEEERRNFGIADDIYAAGLLLAFLAFVPFCEPGSCDGPTIQVNRGMP